MNKLIVAALLAYSLAVVDTASAAPAATTRGPTRAASSARARPTSRAAQPPRQRTRTRDRAIARTSGGHAIEIRTQATDPGLRVVAASGRDSIRISGKAAGPEVGRDILGFPVGDYARSASFTLDIDRAPLRDVWGRQTYEFKNRRIFQVITQRGWSAHEVASRLAAKVNALPDFRANVQLHGDGSATLSFDKR